MIPVTVGSVHAIVVVVVVVILVFVVIVVVVWLDAVVSVADVSSPIAVIVVLP